MKNTDTKEKVMELLFNFPNKKFHIRELSRILKISAPSVSKAIKQLEKENLIISEKRFLVEIKANLNQDFRNLKRVYNLKTIYNSGLFNYLTEKFQIDTIILFGSYSRGEDVEKSDIDIAIIGKEKKLDLENYEKKLNKKINLEFLDLGKITKELKDSIINGIVLNGYIIS